MKRHINAYTDGSCLTNPGVGGFAAILQANGLEREVKGCYLNPKGTNNRMELMAIVRSLRWCTKVQKEPCSLTVYTDSTYVISCWNHDKYWLSSNERPNNDLWIQVINYCEKHGHEIKFVKVKAHSGIEQNERADRLAKAQAIKARHLVYGK